MRSRSEKRARSDFLIFWRFEPSLRIKRSVSTKRSPPPRFDWSGKTENNWALSRFVRRWRWPKKPEWIWWKSRRRRSRRSAGSWTSASSSTKRPRRQHEAKLKQKQIQVKEVKFRPGTDEGDYQIKLRNLIKFLEEGDKTKITLRFRGREMAHQEFGMRMLERIKVDLEQQAMVEQLPKMEGRQMVMVLAAQEKAALRI